MTINHNYQFVACDSAKTGEQILEQFANMPLQDALNVRVLALEDVFIDFSFPKDAQKPPLYWWLLRFMTAREPKITRTEQYALLKCVAGEAAFDVVRMLPTSPSS